MTKYRNPRKELESQETEELEAQMTLMSEPATSAEEEVWKKRAADKDRYITQIKNETKSRIEELEDKLNKALRGQIKAPKSEEEVENWIKEYPEFAGILETIIEKKVQSATSEARTKIAEVELKQRAVDVKEAFQRLRELHPDVDKLLAKGSDFRVWLEVQPDSYKEMMNGINPEEASLVISTYKSQIKGTKSKKVEDDDSSVNDAAKVVRTSSNSVDLVDDYGDYDYTESDIQKMASKDRRWFEKNEDKIMDAYRKGRVLMDLSGGAR